MSDSTLPKFSSPSQKPPYSSRHLLRKESPHLRRTTEQVKQKWLLGDYTASGYLVKLFSAMKKEGWAITIPSVAEFCKTWEINERRFYRAKAKLISQGRLEERIKGPLELWLPCADKLVSLTDNRDSETDSNVSGSDSFVSPGDSSVSEADNRDSEAPFKQAHSLRSQDSPDLLQISLNSSSTLSQSHPPTQTERENLIDREGNPTEAFRNWLQRKSNELPQKPNFIKRWLKSMAAKPEVQEEYLESLSPRTSESLPHVLGDDLGDVIAEIQVHLSELEWTKDQAIAHVTAGGWLAFASFPMQISMTCWMS